MKQMSPRTSIQQQAKPYLVLLLMIAVSFAYMYYLMFAMIDSSSHFYNNINQVYMAGLMAAPMAAVELLIMKSMYPNRRWNIIGIALAAVATLGFWFAIRDQGAVGNRQFLRSMIPHHASAILMCNEATITDARIQKLCKDIIDGQQKEIVEMQNMLTTPLD
jgi:uncharacterized protein (DUF305 family)